MTFLFFSSSKTTTTTAMATSSSKLPPVISILREALLLPAKTLPLFLPLLLFSLASSTLLFSSTFLSISPLLSDLLHKAKSLAPPRPPIPADALPRLLADALVDVLAVARLHYGPILAAFAASLLLLVAASYAFAMAYLGSSLSPQTLVARVVDRSYKAMVTRLYVLALSIGYSSVAGDSPKTLTTSALSLSGVSILLYFYLYTRWSMSLVISAVEETWGIGALSWSVELFIGNKATGTALTLILMAVRLAIYGAFAALVASDPPTPPDQLMKVGAATAAAAAAWELYGVSVYTVFYYHCRKSHGLDEQVVKVEEGFIYSPLPYSTAVKVGANY
ncbi:uncharacterized protein LOC109711773 isoform X2 [Ananas comosus]|uniref:Uncharacterized protein LOC109711773 isoform X2 n=1 Tax=Ananas comosus TaxID=4615 RepID=A0A6P5F4N5_ANACO|nr:uncharacterized protein LOC109711773 isoform X2 [Ananas comosus]